MKLKKPDKIPVKSILVVFLCLAAGIWLLSWANKPSSTTVKTDFQLQTPAVSPASQGAEISSPYYSTVLPGNLTVKTHNTNPKGFALEQLLASDISGQNKDQLGITIATLPNGGLEEVSDVIFRNRSPEQYQRVVLDWAPSGVVAFQKKGAYEYTVFWAKSNKYASISVSGSADRRAALDNIVSQVLRNWRWQ